MVMAAIPAAIPVDLRIVLRNQSPRFRAEVLVKNYPRTPLGQILVDATESCFHPSVTFTPGSRVYQRQGGAELMEVLSSGPLHAVWNESTDELIWLLGMDLQAGPVRHRRGAGVPEAVSGPWLTTWISTKLQIDPQSPLLIREWLLDKLQETLPGFETFADLQQLKPAAKLVKCVGEAIVSPGDVSRLDCQSITCRMQVPTPWDPHQDYQDFCSPADLCSVADGTRITVYDTEDQQWEKATVVGHTNGAVIIKWFYGGKSHLHPQIPYNKAHQVSITLSPVDAARRQPNHTQSAQLSDKKLRRRPPTAPLKLPPIRQLFEQSTFNGRVVHHDQLDEVLALIPSDDAGMVAYTCRSAQAVLRKRFQGGFLTAVVSSEERLKWAISVDPRVRNIAFYAAGASGNLPMLRAVRAMGLPVATHGLTGHIIEIPWNVEFTAAAQTQLASLSKLVWPDHMPHPLIGAIDIYEYNDHPAHTFMEIAAFKGHTRVLEWAASKGYQFHNEVMRMALRGGCPTTIRVVESRLLNAFDDRLTSVELVWAASQGDLETLRNHLHTLIYLDDPISVPLAAMRAGHYNIVDWFIESVRTDGIAAAAAATNNQPLLERAVKADWDCKHALGMAAKRGDKEMVQYLLDELSDRPGPLFYEPLALIHAAAQGHKEVLDMLLETPHNNNLNETLAVAAISGGHLDLRTAIMDNHAPGPAELKAAAHFGYIELFGDAQNVLFDFDDEDFQDVICAAAAAGHLAIVELLSWRRLRPETWEMAAANGQLHVLKALINSGHEPSVESWILILAAAARINDRETIIWVGRNNPRILTILGLYGYPQPAMVPQFI